MMKSRRGSVELGEKAHRARKFSNGSDSLATPEQTNKCGNGCAPALDDAMRAYQMK